MPESTTSSQSSTPTTYSVNNVTPSNSRWDQVDTANILQSTTPLDWSELPPNNIVPLPVSSSNISSEYRITNSTNNINVLSNQIVYNPSNYTNVTYQRSNVPNGYTTVNPSKGHPQNINGPNVMRPQNGSVISGSTWSNQFALGRFVTQSPGWNGNKTTGGVKKQKRIRTAFTSQQMMELEQEYSRTRYLDRARRIELAEVLRLNERTIKIWFQNRRMKEKKDRAESLEDSEEASTTVSSPEMSSIQMPMLIHEQYPNMKTEAYNQGNIYLEQYPTLSTTVSMPVTSMATPMPAAQIPVQNMYTSFMTEQECQGQFQEVHLQVQPYPSPYSEVQESSTETVSNPEAPAPDTSSNIIEKSWDLSWIRSAQYEDDY